MQANYLLGVTIPNGLVGHPITFLKLIQEYLIRLERETHGAYKASITLTHNLGGTTNERNEEGTTAY